MATANRDSAIKITLGYEGGYTNNPADPGGPTNFGITVADARRYWKNDATAADVRAMPISEAVDIYRQRYWAALCCDDLPAGVDYAVFDYGVNSGIGRSAKVLQRLVGVAQDGKIGAETVAATAKHDPAELVRAICDERLTFLQSLKAWDVFGKGWGARVAGVKTHAMAMAVTAPASLPPVAPPPDVEPVPLPPPRPDTTGAKHVAATGAALAGIVAALKAHSLEMAIGIVVLGIIAAVAVHLLWPKKG